MVARADRRTRRCGGRPNHAPRGGIVIGQDFRTSVPGIWAIGDAAAYDGVRLGLLVASGSAASVCAFQLLQAAVGHPLAVAA